MVVGSIHEQGSKLAAIQSCQPLLLQQGVNSIGLLGNGEMLLTC